MGAHEKVGHDSVASGTPPATFAPHPACHARGVGQDRIEPNSKEPHSLIERIIAGKMSPHLRPNDLARDERAFVISLLQSGSGLLAVFGIGSEDVQKN